VRAFVPWPVSWVELDNIGKIKIYKTGKIIFKKNEGKIKFIKQDKRLFLSLKSGLLEVVELQLEGKKKDSFKNYFFLTN